MGRKKTTTFEWVAEGYEGEAPREGVREDRRALKDRLAACEKLARRMAALPPSARAKLPLDEHFIASLDLYVKVSAGAKKRQLGYVKGLMRDIDLDALDAVVTSLKETGSAG
jgi:ribosomal 50S subunit-associated protein YjgA (DUF615 family)